MFFWSYYCEGSNCKLLTCKDQNPLEMNFDISGLNNVPFSIVKGCLEKSKKYLLQLTFDENFNLEITDGVLLPCVFLAGNT